MSYLHNIVTGRSTELDVEASVAAHNVQCVIGTAPVNILDDPSAAVNVPIKVTSKSDFKKQLGWTESIEDYTCVQSAYASFSMFHVAPVVFINVLDPLNAAHKTAVTATAYTIANGSTTIKSEGVLASSVTVTYVDGEDTKTAEADTDYITSFDTDGYCVITVTSDGALASLTSVNIAYSKLNPAGVTATDIVGGISAAGVRTGIELVDEVYSKLGVIPEILLAPGFSTQAAVAAALEAKAELAGDLTNGRAIVDIESTTTTTVANVATAKGTLGVNSRWVDAYWPKVTKNGFKLWFSAVAAAAYQNIAIENNNIPSQSADNTKIPIEGIVLNDGTELHLTQAQINDYLNAYGIYSGIYFGGWKIWGNNTTAYPDDTDPNDRFSKCVAIGNYLENRFKTEYLSKIGRTTSAKLIQSIVSDFNASLNALVPDVLAGAKVQFLKDENPMSEILEGRFRFRTYYADGTPMEWIYNEFVWDSTILEESLEAAFTD